MATKRPARAHKEGDADSVTEYRLSAVEAAVGEIREAVQGINTSLQKLASLEERHDSTRDGIRAIADSLKDHEDRIRVVEADLPTLRLVRRWIISGVTGVLGLSGVAAFNLILIADKLKGIVQ